MDHIGGPLSIGPYAGKELNCSSFADAAGAGIWRDEVGQQEAVVRLVWLSEGARGFLLMCLVHNVKKIIKKVLNGTVSLPGKYSKLIEEAMLEYREERLALVGAEV